MDLGLLDRTDTALSDLTAAVPHLQDLTVKHFSQHEIQINSFVQSALKSLTFCTTHYCAIYLFFLKAGLVLSVEIAQNHQM